MNTTIEAPALFLSYLCSSIAVGFAVRPEISSFHSANDTHCVGILSVTPKITPNSHLVLRHAHHEAWSVGRQLNFCPPASHLLGQIGLHMFALSLELQPCEAIFVIPIPPARPVCQGAERLLTKPWYPALPRAIPGSTSPHFLLAFGQIYSPKALF